MIVQLTRMLMRHEGLRLKPYRDTGGKLTIGAGRNLDDVGISEQEAIYLLQNDIRIAQDACSRLDCWKRLDSVRRDVLIDMAFNMGIDGLKSFKRFLSAMEFGDWLEASDQMLDSQWETQVGSRAHELARMIVTGEYV